MMEAHPVSSFLSIVRISFLVILKILELDLSSLDLVVSRKLESSSSDDNMIEQRLNHFT